ASDGGASACGKPKIDGDDPSALGLGPPDGGIPASPAAAPDSAQQPGGWTATGAAGCEDLVPAAIAPRLTWSAPSGVSCRFGPPAVSVDGSGDLAAEFGGSSANYPRVFLPANGGPGQILDYGFGANQSYEFILASRPR